MSYASNDIQGGGSGGNAEPSMEEILASIRRILKEDEPGKPAAASPVAAMPEAVPAPPLRPAPMAAAYPPPPPPPPMDMDDDVLLLDASMIARPADFSSATALPAASVPPPDPPQAPQAGPEPLHFSSEPAPFSRDFDPSPRAMPEPVVELPPTVEPDAEPMPLPFGAAVLPATAYTAPPEPAPLPDILAEPEPAAYRPLQPPTMAPLPDPGDAPAFAQPAAAAPAAFWAPPEPEAILDPPIARHMDPPAPAPVLEPKPIRPEPTPAAAFTPDQMPTEPEMNDAPLPDSLVPPESLISDKTTDAAASSIGALVRSMTTEKSVAISKSSSITIEDIVREEIRPLLKAWLDSHLPTLVERVVRAEIERVINRSVV
jgi:cell pole-organizing protein PopZ